MKKTDIAVLVLIVGFSLIVAYFVGQYVMKTTGRGVAKVEVVSTIEPTVKDPSPAIFNDQAINPTVPVSVSSQNNNLPIGQ